MSVSPNTKKRNELDRLITKHENEINQHTENIIELDNQFEKIEDEIEKELNDNNIYKSQLYREIWNDLKVNKVMARNTIFRKIYENQIKYINNKIDIENMLMAQANEKRLKRIDQIKEMKRTKNTNFRETTKKVSNGGKKKKKYRKSKYKKK